MGLALPAGEGGRNPRHFNPYLGTFMFKPLLVLMASPIFAASPWTPTNTTLESAYIGTTLVDWGQTLNIGGDTRETNRVLGQHPKRSTINNYFASLLVLHPIVSYLLPKSGRLIFQSITLGIEIQATTGNYQLNIHCHF